jgi:hypothetical protein
MFVLSVNELTASFMKTVRKISLLVIVAILLSSFSKIDTDSIEYRKLLTLEHEALKANVIGKSYEYGLTGIKDCKKTEIRYLGIIKTKKGKKYKVLTSFFAFTTSEDMCHGTSNIKIYDMNNRYIGKYCVGMPVSLPDALHENRLIYLENAI